MILRIQIDDIRREAGEASNGKSFKMNARNIHGPLRRGGVLAAGCSTGQPSGPVSHRATEGGKQSKNM